MSNSIEFYQSEQRGLSRPAAKVLVFLEGTLCPYLELVEVVRCSWPEFGWARLAFNAAAYPQAGPMAVEDIEILFGMGKSICIQQVYNVAAPGVSVDSIPIFAGQIEGIETKLSGSGERVEITAKDFSANLKRITVYGRRLVNPDGSTVFLAGVDMIFNEDSKGNASTEPVEKGGNSLTVFCAEESQSKLWSYAEVIHYLLCEYLPVGQLQKPDIEQLRVLTENQMVRDFDVTGLSMLEALQRCCERIGLKFKFVCRPESAHPEQAIVFYKNGCGREVELNHQPCGEQYNISKTNISVLHSRKDFWPVTHRYIGLGDFKVYEATFELIKAWDSSKEDTDYNKFSPLTNPDFYKVKDVYRKWCLNEAGDYSNAPYNRGEAFDFSKIFEGSNFVHRSRSFLPVLTTDELGKSLGYFLEVSYDNGSSWRQYLYAFNNLMDECGVWLSSEQLDVDSWVTALKGVLKFRMTASVISDERLNCVIADGPVGSAVPVVDHIITLPRRFKYRKVSGQSIFVNASDGALGSADEIDDSAAVYEFVRKRVRVNSETIEIVDLQMSCPALDYRVGDRVISSPESRDLLSCRSDSRSTNWIERVQMDFEKQCTYLKIIRQRGLRE